MHVGTAQKDIGKAHTELPVVPRTRDVELTRKGKAWHVMLIRALGETLSDGIPTRSRTQYYHCTDRIAYAGRAS